MIKYYKLFDLLNRKGKKKTDLLEIMSSKTLAKLSKGENINSEVIDKICLFLYCQPNDIMEVFEVHEIPQKDGTIETKLLKTFNEEEEEFDYFRIQYMTRRQESYEKTRKRMEEEEKKENKE